MLVSIISISYLACTVAYLLVAALLIVSRAQHRYKALLVGACVLTAAWSAASVAQEIAGSHSHQALLIDLILEQLRSIGWIAVMAYTLFVAYKKVFEPSVGIAYAAIMAASMGYIIWQVAGNPIDVGGFSGPQTSAFASILVSIGGLVIAENLFRNGGSETRWALKYLCFALGGIFGYDLFLYARFALFGHITEEIYAARGAVDAMMAPLIVVAAARSKNWPIDLHVSRRIVFHSATILVAGIYLIGMSAIGYYLRILDSPWGVVARVGFVAGAILVFAILLSSSSLHTRIKNFVNQNFFSYRYDYRQEWLGFIASVSGNLTEVSIPERIVRALASLLDCTAGAAWVHIEEDNTYRRVAAWNATGLPPNVSPQDPLLTLLAATYGIVDIRQNHIDEAPIEASRIPVWIKEHPRMWLVVPLAHSRGLIGFVAFGRPRAERDLNWEDFELLKTAGRQAASYLAEDQAASSLANARRFEDFNKQFAFVVHDLKNLAGQMSLILKNAERFGENPDFQKDVLATVADSLRRMHSLLDQLKQKRTASAPVVRIEIASVLSRLAERWRLQCSKLHLDLGKGAAAVIADPQRLEAVFNHLIQNAVDASGAEGIIEIRLWIAAGTSQSASSRSSGWANIEVADNGPGMDQDFINEKLFQPLDTTKTSGFGLGAYQIRSLVREMGGAIDVESEVGRGTRMIVRLPVAPAVSAPSAGNELTPVARLVS